MKAKHKVGFDQKWTDTRPWLFTKSEEDDDGKSRCAMFCRLCQKHKVNARNGSPVWCTEGCKTLRLDKVVSHENSEQHQQALKLETCHQLGIEASLSEKDAINSKEFAAISTAMKCLHFLIKHNIPHTTIYKDFIEFARDELECPQLQPLNAGKNAKYTSHRTIDEFISCMAEDIEETLKEKINDSPSYSLMMDEATDVSNRKHLAFAVRHVDKKTGEVSVDFVKDLQIPNGTAETIFKEAKKVVEEDLNPESFTAVGSDGCSVMLGKKTGVATRLIEMKPDLISIHCQNHRLALAAKDSFKSIPAFQEADETLNSIFKYYQNSAVKTHSLEKLQKLLDDCEVRKIKKVAHTRWLSHLDAITSIRDTYTALVMDLENAIESGSDRVRIGSGPSAAGLVRKLKNYKFVHLLHFLCDALKPMTQLALTFESNNVDLSIVQPRLQHTLSTLQQLKEKPGLNLRKVPKLTESLGISPNDQEVTTIQNSESTFIDNLVANIQSRFQSSDILNAFSVMCSPTASSAMCGSEDLELLAEHYEMDPDTVLAEWDHVIRLMSDVDETVKMGPSAILKIIRQLKPIAGDICPNIEKLCFTAITLPLSTAEVERVFSDVNRTVTDERNRLKVENTHKLLMLHRNDKYLDLHNAVKRWAGKSNRRIKLV